MIQTIEAVFDGKVIRPEEPLPLEANTRVRVTVETIGVAANRPRSFLQTAQSLNLQGPADWSENLDRYLYETPDEPADGNVP